MKQFRDQFSAQGYFSIKLVITDLIGRWPTPYLLSYSRPGGCTALHMCRNNAEQTSAYIYAYCMYLKTEFSFFITLLVYVAFVYLCIYFYISQENKTGTSSEHYKLTNTLHVPHLGCINVVILGRLLIIK